MNPVSSQEYAQRRATFAATLGEEGVAVIASPPLSPRSHDTHYPYRASSDMLYLCGFDEPGAVLVLAPAHPDGEVVLFVPERNPLREQWEGVRKGPEGAVHEHGAHAAYTLDKLDGMMPQWLQGRETLHYLFGDAQVEQRKESWLAPLRHSALSPLGAPMLCDLRQSLHVQRMRKSPGELGILSRACEISGIAHREAMRAAMPGVREFQLEALLEYNFAVHGASAPAYPSIVAGGPRANILHYTSNRSVLADGELVLIDAGCEFQGYASDITRTFPVNGTFSPPQRDVYTAVLAAHDAIILAIEPGVTHAELQDVSIESLTQALRELGVLHGSLEELIEQKAYRPFYPHGFGHWMGMDVHDVGYYYEGPDIAATLRAGHVLTVEPGLYLPDQEGVPEALRGIGVRIENDLLVTPEGAHLLTPHCPVDPDAIEALVGESAPCFPQDMTWSMI